MVLTWARVMAVDVASVYVDQSMVTHVISGEWEGATWPSQGPPHGTPSLVYWLKFYGVHGGRTRDLHQGQSLGKAGLPTHLPFVS
jgi:hypothetical protein